MHQRHQKVVRLFSQRTLDPKIARPQLRRTAKPGPLVVSMFRRVESTMLLYASMQPSKPAMSLLPKRLQRAWRIWEKRGVRSCDGMLRWVAGQGARDHDGDGRCPRMSSSSPRASG